MALDSPKPSPKNSLRLQKYLAECGFGSRRACEKLIDRGLVTVDGTPVTEQGLQIVPGEHDIRVADRPAVFDPKLYLMLNKPRGYLCTSHDPQGRRTYKELLPDLSARLYTVGRLDFDSEGLLIVTNDGELCNRLIHPSHEIAKIYTVIVARQIKDSELGTLQSGMSLQGERMRMAGIRFMKCNAKGYIYRITLREGKNRQIRRMLTALGVKVYRLRRIQVGPLKLGALRPGESRPLTNAEIASLRSA